MSSHALCLISGRKHLRTVMNYKDTTFFKIQLFLSYKSLLRWSSLAWLTITSQEDGVNYVLPVIDPESLRTRLLWNIKPAPHKLHSGLKHIITNAINVSSSLMAKLDKAMQLADNGHLFHFSPVSTCNGCFHKNRQEGQRNVNIHVHERKSSKQEGPIFPYLMLEDMGLHMLRDCLRK